MVHRLLSVLPALLLATACADPRPTPDAGTPDAGPPDSGEPDAGPPDAGDPDAGTIAVLDWTRFRGASLEAQSQLVGDDTNLYGVTATGFVVTAGCDGGTCDYAWLHADGGVAQPARAMRPPFSDAPVSSTGTRLQLISAPAFSSCSYTNGEPFPVFHGDLLLLDAETGEALSTLADLETHPWSETHFTTAGSWFRVAPRDAGVCGTFNEELRRTTAPYDVAPAWQPGLYVEDELPDGRWAVLSTPTGEFGFIDPEVPGSFDVLATELDSWWVRDGWTYAFSRSPVRRVRVEAPDGARYGFDISEEEGWYQVTASQRWVVLREWIDSAGSRRYRVRDVKGQYPGVDFFILGGRVGDGIHLLGAQDLLLVTNPDQDGAEAPRLFDLRTGALSHPADTRLRATVVGRGEAAIAYDQNVALLIERGRIQQLATGPITAVYSANLPTSPHALPQRDIAVLVRAPRLGVHAVDLFHLRTRQLIQLTENAFYAPMYGWGLGDESCGTPWVTRSMGPGFYTLRTPSSAFYFLEYAPAPDGTALYVMPLDLSTPPRKLTTTVSTVYCRAPLLSLDGRHVGALIDGYDTQPRRWIRSARLE